MSILAPRTALLLLVSVLRAGAGFAADVGLGVFEAHGDVGTVGKPGTILYDAVYLAAREKLAGQVGRKVVVLITDGVDQGSRLKLSDALMAAQRADAIIYSIYYYDPGAYGGGWGFGGGGGEGELRKMSEETGGRVFRVDRKHPLSDAFKQIEDEMRSQYAIAYTPANPNRDGTFRRLDVKTRSKELKVQARKGYYAGGKDSASD